MVLTAYIKNSQGINRLVLSKYVMLNIKKHKNSEAVKIPLR